MDKPPTEEQDTIFVEAYLKHEDKPDAGLIACQRAGIFSPMYPAAVMAEKQLARPEIQLAIKVSRPSVKPRIGMEVSKETILADMDSVFNAAMDAKNHAAAIAARKLSAELIGALNKDVNVNLRLGVKGMTDEQLLRAITKGATLDGEFREIEQRALPSLP